MEYRNTGVTVLGDKDMTKLNKLPLFLAFVFFKGPEEAEVYPIIYSLIKGSRRISLEIWPYFGQISRQQPQVPLPKTELNRNT